VPRIDDADRKGIKLLAQDRQPISQIAKHIGSSYRTIKKIMSEMYANGELTDEDAEAYNLSKDTDEEDKEDSTIPKTKKRFITKAAETLSDELLKDMKKRMSAAQILRDAELLYRKNLESIGFNWEDWVYNALDFFYSKTMEWYADNSGKLDFENILELATEEATMNELVEEL